MDSFAAIVIDKTESGSQARLGDFAVADLMDGDVDVRISHSTINYKDALAVTGTSPVVRRFPMIAGIDFAGTVVRSSHADFAPGEAVVLNGWGVGETHLGGLAGMARVKGDWLIPLPQGLTPEQAMAVGTAGYTAALCLLALERHGLGPEAGPLIVTGAAGGVGSIAVALAAKAGWTVMASTGRPEEEIYLRSLGASEIIDRADLSQPGRPLGKERWAAGIDAVGSHTLANVLAMTRYGGAVAACGLAQGLDLPASVAPFILRGVSLLGIDSVMAPWVRRIAAWNRIAGDLDPAKLAEITTIIGLGEVIPACADLLAGRIRGRLVVETGSADR